MRKVFVAAGEASGDLHASALIRALKARDRGLQFFGLGGDLLRAEGVDLIYDLRTLAVTGFWEVAKRFREFRTIYHDVVDRIDKERPELAILVDYPGMNMRFADELKRRGCRVVYYILPQVWAWRSGRIRQLEKNVDLLLSILPFEKALFNPARVKCEFIGHPLLDLVPVVNEDRSFREKHGISEQAQVIGLLPGSRMVEVTHHYPVMLQAAKQLMSERKHVVAATAVRREIESALYDRFEREAGISLIHIADNRYQLLRSADVSLVASGTATLEAALCEKPFCVVYKTGWLTYEIARRLIRLDLVGLVNIVAGARIVPEFLQKEMNVDNLTDFCRKMLTDRDAAQAVSARLSQVRAKLGEPGATERAAELIYHEFLR